MEWRDGRWGRRDLLRATAVASSWGVLALTACGPAATRSAATTGKSSPLGLQAGPTVSAVPGLITEFNHSQRAVQLFPFATAVGGTAGRYGISTLTRYDVARGATEMFEPLDVALRLRNVDVPSLTTGAGAALQTAGHMYGLPLTQLPWGVRWRTDGFAAAGIGPPAASWTLDEFEAICVQLQVFAASGNSPQIHSALGPFLGQYGMPVSPSTTFWLPDAFEAPGLWSGFVAGFGGSVAEGGQFHLTAPATMQALGRLVDLAQRFAAPPGRAGAPSSAAQSAVLSGCPVDAGADGMWFAPYVPLLHLSQPLPGLTPVDCTAWSWARMPRFPVSPIIPTVVSGLGLAALAPPRSSGTATAASPDALARYVDAAASFLVWLYQPSAQKLLGSAGFIPVAASSAVQTPFWANAAADIGALGDFTNFVDYAAGWPAVPPTDYVGQALAQAATAPAHLPALLAQAEMQLNNWLTQRSQGRTATTP